MDNVRVRVKRGGEGVIVIDFVMVLMRPSTSKQALQAFCLAAQKSIYIEHPTCKDKMFIIFKLKDNQGSIAGGPR